MEYLFELLTEKEIIQLGKHLIKNELFTRGVIMGMELTLLLQIFALILINSWKELKEYEKEK